MSTSEAGPPVVAHSGWRAHVRVPAPGEPVAGWHVSPLVDVLAYQFSWLWILVPLVLAGGNKISDWLVLWTVGVTISFVHRHWTMPYVYLDKQVFSQHPTRFALLFALLMLAVVGTAALYRWKSPPGFFLPVDVAVAAAGALVVAQVMHNDRRGRAFAWWLQAAVFLPFLVAVMLGWSGVFVTHHAASACAVLTLLFIAAALVGARVGAPGWALVVAACVALGIGSVVLALPTLAPKALRGSVLVGPFAVVAALWNVWHTLMQKHGILRLYAAKSAAPLAKRTPAWVDRLFVFSWIPFLAVWVGTEQRELILRFGSSVKTWLEPLVNGVVALRPVLLAPSLVLIVVAATLFVRAERRSGVVSAPRLSMALALTLLNASFLIAHPLKVYIAYGFSHAIEYMVFIWAFQRRRYAHELPHQPLLGRVLKHPVLAYGSYTAVIALTYFLVQYGDDFGLHAGKVMVFGLSAGTWLFAFAIWHSIAHFWFDGFLWKMRLENVRASL